MTVLILAAGLSSAAAAAPEVLRFGLDENGFPPLYFKPSAAERGVFEQIFDEAAKITGDRYVPVFLPNKRKIKAFEDKEIDIEPGVSPEWRKAQAAVSLYSAYFSETEEVLLYHKNDKRDFAKLSDMKGRTLGGIAGFVYPEFAKEIQAGQIKRDDSKDREMMIQKLIKQRVDAIILPRVVAEYWIKTEDKDRALRLGPSVSKRAIAFRFHASKKAGLKRFDKALKQLIDKGKIREIFASFQ